MRVRLLLALFILNLGVVAAGLSSSALAQGGVSELYGEGVHRYYAGDHFGAEEMFRSAIDTGSKDPRAHYFLGLIQEARGGDGLADFEKGAQLEAAGNKAAPIGQSLMRVQGSVRGKIEKARRAARLNVLKAQASNLKKLQAGGETVRSAPAGTGAAPAIVDPQPFAGGMRSSDISADATQPVAPEVTEAANPFPSADSSAASGSTAPADDLFGGSSQPAGGDDLFGSGGTTEPAAGGTDPFGGASDPAPGASDPFGGTTEPAAGGGTDPFGGSSEPAGGSDLFGSGGTSESPSSSSSTDPFGGGDEMGSTDTAADPFGGAGTSEATPAADPFGGSGASDTPETPAADPFGGGDDMGTSETPAADPFGGSGTDTPETPAADPFGGSDGADPFGGSNPFGN
ncbi:MAG: hypothetical protein AAF483_23750 [Planctomycetota bacterium]